MQRIPHCRVIAACDREVLMARQLCERYEIPRSFGDVTEMIGQCCPDVVHITTPPESHLPIAKLCLNLGCHVYVEKPFTLNLPEAEELISLAEQKGRKVTVGHNLQFSPVARRMRRLVREGGLGGAPLHMESYYCYNLANPEYAKVVLADKEHWVRRLPGKLLHNIISHGIARIAEFLTGDTSQVFAHAFSSPLLRSMGEDDILDELRVIISEDRRTTAYFTFSSQMRPSLNHFRIYGPKSGLFFDEDEQSLIQLRGKRFKSYAEKFLPPLVLAKQHVGNLLTNARFFLANDFHMNSGMKHLIESFHQSILDNTPAPIPYREILLTARIMDSIFEQIGAKRQ